MTELTERTEALLTAMGWTRRLNGMWAVDVPKCQGDTVTAARPSIDWCFRHAVPWATAQGWDVSVLSGATTDFQFRDVTVIRTSPFDRIGSAFVQWRPGEPDRTAEAIVTALHDALMGERHEA